MAWLPGGLDDLLDGLLGGWRTNHLIGTLLEGLLAGWLVGRILAGLFNRSVYLLASFRPSLLTGWLTDWLTDSLTD